MGYPTDVRQHAEEHKKGIDANFADSGTALTAGQELSLKAISSKAGRLESCRLITKSEYCQVKIYLDGVQVNRGYQDTPKALLDTYGYCSDSGLMKLSKYDTVNEEYVLELIQPLEFGDSMEIKVKNNEGSSQKCYCDFVWAENA